MYFPIYKTTHADTKRTSFILLPTTLPIYEYKRNVFIYFRNSFIIIKLNGSSLMTARITRRRCLAM